jgi:Tfp pilus assembly PilM family ATPase
MADLQTLGGSTYRNSPGLLSRIADRLPFGARHSHVGLDLDTRMALAVSLEQRSDGMRLKAVVGAKIPPEAVTEWQLTDGPLVAQQLRDLFRRERLSGRSVALSVGGEKAICGFERVDNSEYELVDFVRASVESQIGYNFDSAYCDYEMLESGFGTAQSSLVWGCAPADQVEWLRETVRLAGLNPVAADLRACALANVFAFNYRPASDEASLLVDVNEDMITMVVTRGGVPLISRTVRIAEHWSREVKLPASNRVSSALRENWPSLSQKAEPLTVKTVYLCGRAADRGEYSEGVAAGTDLEVVALDPFAKIDTTAAGIVSESAFAVACGLALRSLKNL